MFTKERSVEEYEEAARVRRLQMSVSDGEGEEMLLLAETPMHMREGVFDEFVGALEFEIGSVESVDRYTKAMKMLRMAEKTFRSKCETYNAICELCRNNEAMLLLENEEGWTFAHELAERLLLPFHVTVPELLESEDDRRISVIDVLFKKGLVPESKGEAAQLYMFLKKRMERSMPTLNYYEIALANFLGFYLGANGCSFGFQSDENLAAAVEERNRRRNGEEESKREDMETRMLNKLD